MTSSVMRMLISNEDLEDFHYSDFLALVVCGRESNVNELQRQYMGALIKQKKKSSTSQLFCLRPSVNPLQFKSVKSDTFRSHGTHVKIRDSEKLASEKSHKSIFDCAAQLFKYKVTDIIIKLFSLDTNAENIFSRRFELGYGLFFSGEKCNPSFPSE